jgi:hypothetical protein
MAATAVQRRGISIAMACRTFGVSETCHRNSPLLSDENEQIADLLVGLASLAWCALSQTCPNFSFIRQAARPLRSRA